MGLQGFSSETSGEFTAALQRSPGLRKMVGASEKPIKFLKVYGGSEMTLAR